MNFNSSKIVDPGFIEAIYQQLENKIFALFSFTLGHIPFYIPQSHVLFVTNNNWKTKKTIMHIMQEIVH